MTRRTVAALGAAALAATLTSCGTFSDNDAAAVVEGVEVPREQFERVLRVFSENAEVTNMVEDFDTVSVPGEAARPWLAALVAGAASDRFLEQHGEAVTDADRQALLDNANPDDPVLDFPEDVLGFLVDQRAGVTARQRIAAPDVADLARRYADDPAGLGVLCVRHILVETEAEADDVLAELDGGADFAALAADRSIDPTAADNGGAITGTDGGACQPLPTAAQSLDGEFLAGAVEARPGDAVGPVSTQFGYHVIEAVPYEAAADSLQTLYAGSAGELLFAGYLLRADVHVDPRYGTWDGVTRTITTPVPTPA